MCAKFHKNRLNNKKSYDSSMPLYNHVYGLGKFSASVSTGAWGRRKQHRGELTGPGGTLDGVSSPHMCLLQSSREKFFSFQPIWTKLRTTTGDPRRGPPNNFEENLTTLSGLHRLKAKMTRKNLTDVDQIYRIFVSMYYTRFTKI